MLNCFALLILSLSCSSACITGDTDNTFDFLADKIEKLEQDYKDENVALRKQIKEIQNEFSDKLLQQVFNLQAKLSDTQDTRKDDEHENKPHVSAGLTQTIASSDTEHLRKMFSKHKTFPGRRSVVENEIAFYATHSTHDNQHPGDNQIIVFDNVITNIGNAYNSHGGFVTPVDGTYVIHGTMMGISSSDSAHRYCAYIDIDGVRYSEFWVNDWDQSSQMLVKELKAGQTVTIKNCRANDKFIGQHYSSFSGFLLYQHSGEQVIVGK